jgi:uncharacterized membrane protein YesL
MNKITSNLYESEALQKVSSFILANLLWILLSIPVVTFPAATAGLFATLGPWVRGKSASVFPNFFEGMQRHWVKSVLVAAVDLGIGGLVGGNLLILYSMNLPRIPAILSLSATVTVALLAILVNIYIWPSMVMFETSFRQLVGNSIRLVVRHPWWSILVLGMVLLIVGLSTLLPRFFVLFGTFSGCALVMCWGQWRVARRYLDADQLARLEATREKLSG